MIVPGVAQLYSVREIDFSIHPEIGARLPGRSVQGNQPRVERPDKDPQRAQFPRFGMGFAPSGNTPRGDFRGSVGQLQLRIKLPELRASLGIQSDHMIVRSAEKELSVNQDRRGLKRGFLVEFFVMRQRAGAMSPRDLKLRHVGAVNLRGWRIAGPAAIVAIVRPAGFRLGLRRSMRYQA